MTTGAKNTTKTLHLPIDGGMDQRSHPRQVELPNNVAVYNARFRKLGGLEKRFGTSILGNSFTVPGGGTYALKPNGVAKVIGFRDELVVSDSWRIGSHSPADETERFIDKGKVPECTSTTYGVSTSQQSVLANDTLVSPDGLIFHTWVGAAGLSPSVFVTVRDRVTGAEWQSGTLQATNRLSPKLVEMGGIVVLLYMSNYFGGFAALTIYGRIWNPTTMSFGVETALSDAELVVTSEFAACSFQSNTFLVAFTVSSGASQELYVQEYFSDLSFSAQSSATVVPVNSLGIGIAANNARTRAWVSFIQGNISIDGHVHGWVLDNNLDEITAPFVVYQPAPVSPLIAKTNPTVLPDGDAVILISALSGGGSITEDGFRLLYPVFNENGTVAGNATPTNRRTFWAVGVSKAFIATTSPLRVYAWAYVGGATHDVMLPPRRPVQQTAILIDLLCDDTDTAVYVARPIVWQFPRITAPITNGVYLLMSSLASVPSLGSGKFVTTALVQLNASGNITSNAARIGLFELYADFQDESRLLSAEIGRTLYLVPGFYYDRTRMSEIGFSYWPQIGTATVNGVGAAGTTSTSFRCEYEHIDANGAIHRSDVSEAFVVTAKVDSTTYTINVPSLTVTCRQYGPTPSSVGVRIAVYRSTTTSPGQPTPYVLFTFIQNNPLTRYSSKTLGLTGDLISDYPEGIYTIGGVLPNVMPASFTSIVTYRNRLWVASGNRVFFSKAFVYGEPANFADAFNLPLEETGDIRALWKMDDTLFISTDKAIYWLQANGPNDLGTQSDIDTPNRVATDLGVVDQRSIVVTPIGTLYQSTVGIQLLDRARSVNPEPIGARVQEDLKTCPFICSTNVHPTGRYVTFACKNLPGDVASGFRLVYDYTVNRWSRDVVLAGNHIIGQPILSEAVVRGRLYFLTPSGSTLRIAYEDPATHLDNGSWVPMGIRMAEIHPSGLQGWLGLKRTQLSHQRHTDHDLGIGWWKNYETNPFEVRSIVSNVISAEAFDGTLEQFSANVAIHRTQSVGIEIIDNLPSGPGAVTGTGKGSTFIGIAVTIDQIDGEPYRLSSGKKT